METNTTVKQVDMGKFDKHMSAEEIKYKVKTNRKSSFNDFMKNIFFINTMLVSVPLTLLLGMFSISYIVTATGPEKGEIITKIVLTGLVFAFLLPALFTLIAYFFEEYVFSLFAKSKNKEKMRYDFDGLREEASNVFGFQVQEKDLSDDSIYKLYKNKINSVKLFDMEIPEQDNVLTFNITLKNVDGFLTVPTKSY